MAWAYLMMTLLLALPSGLMAMNMPTLALMAFLPSEIAAITCYICSSYGGLWGCLDPFDYQPIVRWPFDFYTFILPRSTAYKNWSSGKIVTLSHGCEGRLTQCSARRERTLWTGSTSPPGAAARRPGRTSKATRAWETGMSRALEEDGRRPACAAKTLATRLLQSRRCPGCFHSLHHTGSFADYKYYDVALQGVLGADFFRFLGG